MKVALIILIIASILTVCSTPEDWRLIDAGRFYRVEYELGARGALTVIHWEDGRTNFISGLQRIEYIVPGDSIEIYEDNNSSNYSYRIMKRKKVEAK
jgi:hypothetical protein